MRTIREACGVSMGDLADALGWSLPMLSDKERGERPVLAGDAESYASALAGLVRERSLVRVVILGASDEAEGGGAS